MSSKAILTDTTLCTGCEECVKACKEVNNLLEDRPHRWQRAIDDLSSTRFTTILRRPGNRFVRKFCRHCLKPACVSACLVGALEKTPDGPVIYDGDRCMGCRYCMVACPYDIPRYDWHASVPYVRKCTLCYDRLKSGKEPGCTEACPEKATIFGSREDLRDEAHHRIKTNPERYVNRVFGEHEVGGTSVMYLSDIPLEFLGWGDDMGVEAIPELTWAALKKVPPAILGVGGLMAGIHWIIGRRMRMQALAGLSDAPSSEEDAPPTAEKLRGCFKTRSAGPRPSEAASGEERRRGDTMKSIVEEASTKHDVAAAGRSQDGVLKQPLKGEEEHD